MVGGQTSKYFHKKIYTISGKANEQVRIGGVIKFRIFSLSSHPIPRRYLRLLNTCPQNDETRRSELTEIKAKLQREINITLLLKNKLCVKKCLQI